MTGQPEITQVTIGPPVLLCYSKTLLCGCIGLGGSRLVAYPKTGQAKIHFPYTQRIHPTGQARRRELAHPTNPATRSRIEWPVLRASHDWLDTKAAKGRYDEGLVKELAL
jgi:hypothetical protein